MHTALIAMAVLSPCWSVCLKFYLRITCQELFLLWVWMRVWVIFKRKKKKKKNPTTPWWRQNYPPSRVEPAGGKQQAPYSVTKTNVRRPAVQWKQRLSSKNTQAALTFPGWSWRGMPRCSALQPVPCCRGDPPCRRCRRNWPAAGGRQSPGPGADTPEPGQTHTSWWPARPAASTSAPTETQTTPFIYNTHCFHFCFILQIFDKDSSQLRWKHRNKASTCMSLTKIHCSCYFHLGGSVEKNKPVPACPWQRFITAVTFISVEMQKRTS